MDLASKKRKVKAVKEKVNTVRNLTGGGSGGGGRNSGGGGRGGRGGRRGGNKKGILAIVAIAAIVIIGLGVFALFGGNVGGLLEGLTGDGETVLVDANQPDAPGGDAQADAPVPPPTGEATGEVRVHFIDVGQGDSILVQCDNHAILIDAGDNRIATRETILGYLADMGVTRLDYIVATHPHLDHIGSFIHIINSDAVEVGRVMMPDVTHTSAAFRNFIAAIDENDIPATIATQGHTFRLGEMDFTVVAPGDVSFSNLNNASVVLRMTHGANSFLFTGDAEVPSERNMLDNGMYLRSDIMQAGHHGSRTSSSSDFVAAVNPRVAAISVGAGNSYNHPHTEILDLFEEHNLLVLRTDELGHMVFVSCGADVLMPDGQRLRSLN
ncbi:MAG: MBL fold metallo-hydrolase [Defluviitaleaceae bacterium]|nr:MBL fold metallo-hydrolase [Defluviitaleaceae bacterium]